MEARKMIDFIKDVVKNTPNDWLKLTTHRLDIYNEALAKTEFLDAFNALYKNHNSAAGALQNLPTAYDYIRLGHPLSSVLEWAIAQQNQLAAENVISFSSQTMPILAVLRKNHFADKATQILHIGPLPQHFDADIIKRVYGYNFETKQIENAQSVSKFSGSTILVTKGLALGKIDFDQNVDFYVNIDDNLGSIITINSRENHEFMAEIQHVRRRESIAMTPANCFAALQKMVDNSYKIEPLKTTEKNKVVVEEAIQKITHTTATPLMGSSGLSVQYAIMMGLIHHAIENNPGKAIHIIVPPNCYGGTNDQARRVAACLQNVEIVDLPVDGENDMVRSTDRVLSEAAQKDAVPLIIAEIPTNPRVEVPEMEALKNALSQKRTTPTGQVAIAPVFILDQTFCPNVNFLGEGQMLSEVKTIAYVSGSKFPSGGKCTAGYCTANTRAAHLLEKIDLHFKICDNQATPLQLEILAEQLPSMNARIAKAYKNTREFVTFIEQTLPEAKINFVSETLAEQGFTPSVFSLDLPTKGQTAEERETYKRALNHKLINLMITEIPDESKYCVSYGQLKGCYWTIPATSTQGTTKEGDKDYIARVAVSPDLDLEKHKQVFEEFVISIK